MKSPPTLHQEQPAVGVVVATLLGTAGRVKVELISIRVKVALAPHPKGNGVKRQPPTAVGVVRRRARAVGQGGGFFVSDRGALYMTDRTLWVFTLIRSVSVGAYFLTNIDTSGDVRVFLDSFLQTSRFVN